MKEVFVLNPVSMNRQAGIDKLVAFLHSANKEKPLKVEVRIARPSRTLSQNAYLWAVPYRMLSDATGFEAEDLHEYLLGEYFGWNRVPMPGGRFKEVPARTTTVNEYGEPEELGIEAFAKYWEYIQRRAATDWGIVIPDPDPEWKAKTG